MVDNDQEQEPVSEPTEEEKELRRRQTLLNSVEDVINYLRAHPEVPVPYDLQTQFDTFVNKEQFGKLLRLEGNWEKVAADTFFTLERTFGSVVFRINLARSDVCKRVVTGKKTMMVPDPNAPEIPEEVEVYSWECPESLLKEFPSGD